MNIEPLLEINQIKEGDVLLITDGHQITHSTAQRVKVTDHDGTEVILNLRLNKYFNVGFYLEGRSWAKEVYIVRSGEPGIAPKGWDAEFLAKRLGRVAKLAGVPMPDLGYEGIAEAAGTILSAIASKMEQQAAPTKQTDLELTGGNCAQHEESDTDGGSRAGWENEP